MSRLPTIGPRVRVPTDTAGDVDSQGFLRGLARGTAAVGQSLAREGDQLRTAQSAGELSTARAMLSERAGKLFADLQGIQDPDEMETVWREGTESAHTDAAHQKNTNCGTK